MKKPDLTGQRFGRLIVKEKVGVDRYGRAIWLCVCDCGKESITKSPYLTRGETKSCGCLKLENRSRWKGVGEISGAYLCKLKANAKIRGIDFDVDNKHLWELFLHQGRKCAKSGVPISFSRRHGKRGEEQTASLDRIDSSRGYVPGNIQWVHKVVNIMKQSLGDQELVEWCRRIITHTDEQEQQKRVA